MERESRAYDLQEMKPVVSGRVDSPLRPPEAHGGIKQLERYFFSGSDCSTKRKTELTTFKGTAPSDVLELSPWGVQRPW